MSLLMMEQIRLMLDQDAISPFQLRQKVVVRHKLEVVDAHVQIDIILMKILSMW